MKVKTIEINGSRYVLPAGMTTKDVQSLAGFLLTLEQIEYHWLTETPNTDRVLYANGTPSVRLAEVDLIDKDEADRIYEEDQARRRAKREAEQS